MPLPALAALLPMISQKSAQNKQNLFNLGATLFMNRKERKWNEQMYERQRNDALADWAMMNEYNSPANQMKRFKEANLNPNLIYGQTNEAAPVRSTEMKAWSPSTPEFRIDDTVSGGLASYYDLEMKQAQTNNLAAATAVANQDAILRASQVAGAAIRNETDQFNLDQAKKLQSVTLEKAAQELKNLRATEDLTKANTQTTLSRNEREAAMNASNLREAAERILNLREQRATTNAQREQIRQATDNLRKDGQLKDIEIQLRKQGINPSDWIWWRKLQEVVNSALDRVSKGMAGEGQF